MTYDNSRHMTPYKIPEHLLFYIQLFHYVYFASLSRMLDPVHDGTMILTDISNYRPYNDTASQAS